MRRRIVLHPGSLHQQSLTCVAQTASGPTSGASQPDLAAAPKRRRHNLAEAVVLAPTAQANFLAACTEALAALAVCTGASGVAGTEAIIAPPSAAPVAPADAGTHVHPSLGPAGLDIEDMAKRAACAVALCGPIPLGTEESYLLQVRGTVIFVCLGGCLVCLRVVG